MSKEREIELQVFTDGRMVELADFDVDSLTHVNEKLNIREQFDILISHFTSLARTVNVNAAFLRQFILKSTKQQKAENYLYEVLHNFNDLIHTLEPSASYDDLLEKENNSANQDSKSYEWTKTINEHRKATKLIVNKLRSLPVKTQIEELQKAHETIEKKVLTLENKEKGISSELDRFKTNIHQNNLLYVQLNSKNEEMQQKIEVLDSPDFLLQSESISNINNKMNELNQQINEISNKTSLLAKSISMPNSINVPDRQIDTSFRKQILEEINFLKENIEKDNSKLGKKILDLEKLVNDQLSDLYQNLDNLKVKNKTFSLSHENENVKGPLSANIVELEALIQNQERGFLKKFMILENMIKELSDIRKYEKIIPKIQIDLNSKISQELFNAEVQSKLDRGDFFDFVNQNLVSVDQMKTFNSELLKVSHELQDKLTCHENFINKLRKIVERNKDTTNGSFSNFQQEIVNIEKKLSDMEAQNFNTQDKFKCFDAETKKFQNNINHLLTLRAHKLATTQQLRCLSCGEKELFYPPLTKFVEGKNGYIYEQRDGSPVKMTYDDECSQFRENNKIIFKGPEYVKTENLRDQKAHKMAKIKMLEGTRKKEKRIWSAISGPQKDEIKVKPRFLKLPASEYVTAEQVITPASVAIEHTIVNHFKSDTELVVKNSNRPFSSIAKTPLYRVN